MSRISEGTILVLELGLALEELGRQTALEMVSDGISRNPQLHIRHTGRLLVRINNELHHELHLGGLIPRWDTFKAYGCESFSAPLIRRRKLHVKVQLIREQPLLRFDFNWCTREVKGLSKLIHDVEVKDDEIGDFLGEDH